MNTEKSVGLVLGSGSSRGWAHIGVLEAMAERQIPIDFIVGCSVGSYVAALYACGGLQSLKQFILKMDGKKVFSYFDIVLPRSGLLDGTKRLRELFCMHTDIRDFSELKIPVMMVATDLETGAKVILKSGSILDALRASMSIPGIFAPARLNQRWLVDGGVVDPVPVSVARAMAADVVIAVDLNSALVSRQKPRHRPKPASEKKPAPEAGMSEMIRKLAEFYTLAGKGFRSRMHEMLGKESSQPDIIETVTTAIHIMQDRITRINLAVTPPDILIQPRLGGLKMLDFDQVAHTIEEGHVAATEKIADIETLLQ
jgi:NTE family protein